MYCSQ
jgi:hypothetical protein